MGALWERGTILGGTWKFPWSKGLFNTKLWIFWKKLSPPTYQQHCLNILDHLVQEATCIEFQRPKPKQRKLRCYLLGLRRCIPYTPSLLYWFFPKCLFSDLGSLAEHPLHPSHRSTWISGGPQVPKHKCCSDQLEVDLIWPFLTWVQLGKCWNVACLWLQQCIVAQYKTRQELYSFGRYCYSNPFPKLSYVLFGIQKKVGVKATKWQRLEMNTWWTFKWQTFKDL